MGISELHKTAGEWLRGAGPESDIVISSRVRLARNVEGFPFIPQLSPEKRSELESLLRDKILETSFPRRMNYLNLKDLEPVDRLLLVERHLISREHMNTDGDRGVAFSEQEMVCIMTNEEDHLRLQVIRSGLQVEDTWNEIDQIDNLLEKRIRYSFSPQFGYLTACPTNVGTGMRVSVMLHLPALVLTKQIEKVYHAVAKVNLSVRGLYGEGTQASGDFYQISNQVTLGVAETDLVREFRGIVPKIIEYERRVREELVKDDKGRLEDRVWRAYGQLKNARQISSEETIEHLSLVRMGVNLGLLNSLDMSVVNELFIFTQPGHLQKATGKIMKDKDRDVARANFIRSRLETK
jgi:protein arginine kinase